MLNFSTDQWIIVLLVFVLGLLLGGFLFTGGGRKWKTRYKTEADRRADLERTHTVREKEWREQDSLRAAALKDRDRDGVPDNRDEVVDRRGPLVDRRGPVVDRRDSDGDGVPDDRDPVDDRKQ
ncbi:MAG: hypothetical protein ABIP07_06755 [Sphingomicrobium sp.]